LESDEFIPANLVLISLSEPEGLCYIETSNLDGETNLKIKQASPQTYSLTSPSLASALHGTLRLEQPNNSLYTYEGTLELVNDMNVPKTVSLGPDQMLLRGAQLRNTPWVYGIVVFTGHETKLMLNATAAPIKRTAVEHQVNIHIIFLFVFLLALSLGSTVGVSINTWFLSGQQWYLVESSTFTGKAKAFIEDILTFIILYNNLIPISLIITMEVVKFQQAQLINANLDMYYAPSDTPALCRTSSLVEELQGLLYGEAEKSVSTGAIEDREREVAREFMALLAVCHTVIPEVRDGKTHYQASGPDEAALVAGAEMVGYQFHTRKPRSVFLSINNVPAEYEILNVCKFNSTRKRMSTIVRTPSGSIKLFCKGADTIVLERLAKAQPYTEKTLIHLKDYATEGLRTLCIAYRDIPEAEYRQWASIYKQAAATISFGFRVRVPILVSPSCTNEHPSLWTKYTVAGECKPSSMNEHLTNTFSSVIPGSFIFTMLFLPLYAVVAPAIGFSTEYYGLVPRLWTDAVFYFVLILVPIVCLTRDFIWK
ncbi:hypothetical protein EDD22DRAFT_782131, partial [Suillus occidentalis]